MDWIFPNDHIDYATPKVIEAWKKRTQELDFHEPLCLRTPANMDAKCHACKACEPSHIKFMTKREINVDAKMDDVITALESSIISDTTKVVVKLDSKWDIVSKTMLSHYITSKILRANTDLVDLFHSVGKNTTTWVSSNGQKDYFSGTFTFDINWKLPVGSRINEYIEEVNKDLESCKILAIHPGMKQLQNVIQSNVTYLGQIEGVSMSKIKDKMSMFDWKIKKAVKSMGGMLETETVYMPELKDRITFVTYKNMVLTSMNLPSNISPYLVLNSILGLNVQKCYEQANFQVIAHGKEVDAMCQCGKHLEHSMITNSVSRYCPTCASKVMMKKIISQ